MRTIVYNHHFGCEEDTAELLADGHFLVGIDRVAGWRRLGELLLENGHDTLLLPDCHPKRGGLRQRALRELGLNLIERRKPDVPGDADDLKASIYAECIEESLGAEPFTAVCLHSDEIAGFLLVELAAREIRVPEDVSVVGSNGIELSAAFKTPLTTMRIPVARMVAVVNDIHNNGETRQEHVFVPELVLGASHGPARKR